MKDQQSIFHKCCHCFTKEFKRENFKLNHVPVDDFYISQVSELNDNRHLAWSGCLVWFGRSLRYMEGGY